MRFYFHLKDLVLYRVSWSNGSGSSLDTPLQPLNPLCLHLHFRLLLLLITQLLRHTNHAAIVRQDLSAQKFLMPLLLLLPGRPHGLRLLYQGVQVERAQDPLPVLEGLACLDR